MAQCNTIFTAVYYFLECYWSGCKFEVKMAQPSEANELILLVSYPLRWSQTKLKIIGMEQLIYRRSWPIEAMMGVR